MVNRQDPAFFGTIGFFANTVALRCQVAPTLSFAQFLDVVSETVHDAFDYQHVPFELVVDALAPQRDAERNPLFEAAIRYASLDPRETWTLDGLQVTSLPDPPEVSGLQFSLVLDVRRLAGRVDIIVEYDRQWFSDAAMQRFAQAYGNLLLALCGTPDVL
ncbi:MAG: condensation domain-containing protein [Actinomycetota bacterium]